MSNHLFLKINYCVAALAFMVFAALGFSAAHAAEGLFPNPTAMAPPAKPTKLPDFDFANLHGGALKASEMKGKFIIIRFWATW